MGRRTLAPRHLRAASVAVLVATLAFASGGGAAPLWLPARQLSPGSRPSVDWVDLAANRAGDATVVWVRSGAIQAVTRPAGGTWSAPVDVGAGRMPSVAIDGRGDAFAVYASGASPSATYVQAATRPGPTAGWEPPVTLSPAVGATSPALAAGEGGVAAAAWLWFDGSSYVAQASYRPSAGEWEHAVDLAPLADAPAVAVNDRGDAVVAWSARRQSVIQAAVRPAAGAWQAPVDVSSPGAGSVIDLHLALTSAGDAVAAWRFVGPIETGPNIVQASFRPAGGAWSPVASISSPRGDPENLRLRVDAAGDALLVWKDIGRNGRIESARRPAAAAAWEAPVVVAAAGGDFLDLGMDRRGNAVAVWTDSLTVRAALRPAASGAWQPPAAVESAERSVFFPVVAMGPDGHAVVAWMRVHAGSSLPVVDTADLLGSGPILQAVTVPRRAVARVPVTFRVSAVPWAAPIAGAPRWRFGDGAAADGATVTHAYATPGTYSVSVEATDAAGGTSTAATSIVVSAPTRPRNTVRPAIHGRPRVGARLVCVRGSWVGTPPMQFTYAWLRDRRRIAAGRAHRVAPLDAGTVLACRVRATNPGGSAESTSHAFRIPR